jgi:hypothetical protein
MKTSSFAVLFVIFIFSQLTLLKASASIYEYEWIGGQTGFSGEIFLDAPSSALAPNGGRDTDVLPGSFLSTPLGTFSVLDTGLDASFGAAGAMSWNSSQITVMWLFFQPTTPINNPAYNKPAIGAAIVGEEGVGNAIEVGSLVGGFGTAYAFDDFSGQWLAAPVPEPAIASLILLGAIAALGRVMRKTGTRI